MADDPSTTILEIIPNPPANDPIQQVPAGEDFLSKLVGDGGKYKDVQELAKAYVHADEFIEKLKEEKREVEERLLHSEARNRTADEILIALRSPQPQTALEMAMEDNENSVNQTMSTPKETPSSEDRVAELVTSLLEKRERSERAKKQKEIVWSKLTQAFGSKDEADAAVAEYAAGNADRLVALNQLGMTDPDAVVEILKKVRKPKENLSSPPTEMTFSNVGNNKMTWTEAQKIRRTNPKLFWSRAFQNTLTKLTESNPDFLNT